jgi:hypothetical protein
VGGRAADLAAGLYDPARLAEARLGPEAPNPRFDPAPALAFAHRPGAPLDHRRFRHRRALAARPSPDGLVRLALTPEDLAAARPDLADLRLADAQGRQWAFLLEDEAAEARVELAMAPERAPGAGATRLRLAPPAAPARVAEVALDFAEPFFDRAFTLEGVEEGGEPRPLAHGRLVRRAGDPRPLVLDWPPRRLDALVLTIEDGDDAPLTLRRAEATLPLPELYFAAPAGDYALLLGDPEAAAPRYELARARDVVLAVAAGEADAGPLEANPDFRRAARLASDRGLRTVLVWAAIGLAAVVLAVLTLRLARREGEGPGG